MARTNTLPGSLARRFARRFGGYTVGLTAALAPALGGTKISGLALMGPVFPSGFRNVLSVFATALIVFVVVRMELLAHNDPSKRKRSETARRGQRSLAAGFVALLLVYFPLVEHIQVGEQRESLAVIIAPWRTSYCKCLDSTPNSQCIIDISVDEAALDGCWGSFPRATSKAILAGSYLLMIYGFGLLVGILALPGMVNRPSSSADPPTQDYRKRRRRRGSGKEAGHLELQGASDDVGRGPGARR